MCEKWVTVRQGPGFRRYVQRLCLCDDPFSPKAWLLPGGGLDRDRVTGHGGSVHSTAMDMDRDEGRAGSEKRDVSREGKKQIRTRVPASMKASEILEEKKHISALSALSAQRQIPLNKGEAAPEEGTGGE